MERFNLWPFQASSVEQVLAARAHGRDRLLIVLPTGCGKTVIAAHLAARSPGPVLLLSHRMEILKQTTAKIATADGTGDSTRIGYR